jgi:hypothetical protein
MFPAETAEGLNTFGAYIDGRPFLTATTLFGNVRPVTGIYFPGANPNYPPGFLSILGIDARYQLEDAGRIVFQKLGVFGPGEYPISHVFNCPKPEDCDGGAYVKANTNQVYFILSGMVTITKLDTVQKIVAGRFAFVVKDSLNNTRRVTNGVFDCTYIP